MSIGTELTLAGRAAVALGAPEYEKRLVELKAKHASIVAITNDAGRAECHAALMEVKRARTDIEKSAKAARDDATQFARAVITEERRLVDLIKPEEERLAALRDGWDAERERERQERIEAERKRIEALREKIGGIKRRALLIIGLPAARIEQAIGELDAFELTAEMFAELLDEAKTAKIETLATMQQALERQQATEAEQARIAQERAELERQKAEEEARARREAEEAELRQRREAEEAERQRIAAAEKAEADRRAEEARKDRERADAALKEQERRLSEERAALEREKHRQRIEQQRREREAEEKRVLALASDPVAALRECRRLLIDGALHDHEKIEKLVLVVSTALALVETEPEAVPAVDVNVTEAA